MRRLGGARAHYDEAPANPMDGLSNLADAMLVLSVGIMLALIINWKVDINPAQTQEQVQEEQITITEDDLSESSDEPDEDALTEVGALYYDEETGTFYVISH